MNIAIIGYGKMGHAVESVGTAQGHLFPLIVDVDNREDLNEERLRQVDVAIEFSTPQTAPGNILACLDHYVPVVKGTTGWNKSFGEIEQ